MFLVYGIMMFMKRFDKTNDLVTVKHYLRSGLTTNDHCDFLLLFFGQVPAYEPCCGYARYEKYEVFTVNLV